MKRAILLLISHSCNLNCKYCYEIHKDSRKMSIETALRILENEFKHSPENITNIDLLGGEPLINFPVLKAICHWIWDKNGHIPIFVRTNGTLLNNEMKTWFTKHMDKIGLGLSIDGTPYTNKYNRGVEYVDYEFFKSNWPDIPVKITVFPDTVDYLYENILYLISLGFNITGGLAQGVVWDTNVCKKLSAQLEKLTDFYLKNLDLTPVSPLYPIDFQNAYLSIDSEDIEVCWKRDIVNTYDCEAELLPCHMLSVVVQGKNEKKRVAEIISSVSKAVIDEDCNNCPIRWSCSNCIALNYQHFKDIHKNANKLYSCGAHKIAAYWAAYYLASKANVLDNKDIPPKEKEAILKAIRFLKEKINAK